MPSDRATHLTQKADRNRDAALAREEYKADLRGVPINTELLRPLRLAREAGEEIKEPVKATKKGC